MDDEEIVWYRIYLDLDELSNTVSVEDQLQELTTQSLSIVSSVAEGYIWQHEPFNLRVCSRFDDSFLDTSSSGTKSLGEWKDNSSISEFSSVDAFIPHLVGKVKFGDNLEDEWFVVYLLLEISRQYPSVSITVRDSDGEFLLIEAGYFIPSWLKPENSHNRVFLRHGAIHIVPPSRAAIGPRKSSATTSLSNSLQVLSNGSVGTMASPEVQKVIFARIAGYPEKAKKNVHRVRCKVPVSVAHILTNEPQLIALAVESFYSRDMDAMKAASRMDKFSPKGMDGKVELVDIVVRMSRAMYAQLVQQVFQAPRTYPMPSLNSPGFKEAEIGMKIAVGFEMMYWERSSSEILDLVAGADNKVGGLSGEVLKEQAPNQKKGEVPINDVGWQRYRTSLEESGYFKGLLEGSKEHRHLLQAAVTQYRRTSLFARVSAAMHAPVKRIDELLSMPYSVSDFSSTSLEQSDDDSWLYNGEQDLATVLMQRQKEMDEYESKKHKGKRATAGCASAKNAKAEDVGAAEIVRSMQSFVNKISSFEGAEIPGKGVNHVAGGEAVDLDMSKLLKELESVFDPKEISSMLSEGLADEEDTHMSSDTDLDDSASGSEVEMEDNTEMAQVEESLRSNREVELTDKEEDVQGATFDDEYSDVLDKELKGSSLRKSFAKGNLSDDFKISEKAEPGFNMVDKLEIEADDEDDLVDVDVNLVDSLLRSYMFQQGMPGPASNLLGAMGIDLPDNADQRPGSCKLPDR